MPSAAERERWRLLETWDGDPGLQMALDEALLRSADPRPALRVYTWRPEALSLGYFQRLADVPEAARAPAVVRRQTGGGAIHHARELTFSIAAPADHPLFRGPVAESYARIHGLVADALAAFGVRATLRGDAPLASDAPASGMCFRRSTPLDLAWDGRKGVGSAQRRSRGRVLHHGSIKLGSTALEREVATVGGATPPAPTAVAARLAAVLVERLEVDLAPEPPAPAELRHAEARAAHFASDPFVRRR